MLRDYASYIIVGHSECRANLNETDETVNRKAKAALAVGLGGNHRRWRKPGTERRRADRVLRQRTSSGGFRRPLPAADMAKVVIAYEPIWAIGTGRLSASGEARQCDNRVRPARTAISDMYGQARRGSHAHSIRRQRQAVEYG